MGVDSDWLMLLLSRVTAGREGETVTGRVRVRPSLRETWAVSCSPGWSSGFGALSGRVRRRLVSEFAWVLAWQLAWVLVWEVAGESPVAGVKVWLLRTSFWT